MTFAIGVFVSFLIYIAIGVYVGRKVENQEDYFVAGRGAPALLITGSLVASYLSTVGFMGEVGFGLFSSSWSIICRSRRRSQQHHSPCKQTTIGV